MLGIADEFGETPIEDLPVIFRIAGYLTVYLSTLDEALAKPDLDAQMRERLTHVRRSIHDATRELFDELAELRTALLPFARLAHQRLEADPSIAALSDSHPGFAIGTGDKIALGDWRRALTAMDRNRPLTGDQRRALRQAAEAHRADTRARGLDAMFDALERDGDG